jgi:hypothetical protein
MRHKAENFTKSKNCQLATSKTPLRLSPLSISKNCVI